MNVKLFLNRNQTISFFRNNLIQWNDITVGNCFAFTHRDSITQHYKTQAGPTQDKSYVNDFIL